MNLKGSSSGVQRELKGSSRDDSDADVFISNFDALHQPFWCVARGCLVCPSGRFGASLGVVWCVVQGGLYASLPAPCSLLPAPSQGRRHSSCLSYEAKPCVHLTPAKHQVLSSEIPNPFQRNTRPIPTNSQTHPGEQPDQSQSLATSNRSTV